MKIKTFGNKLISCLLCITILVSGLSLGTFATTEYTYGDYTYTVVSGEAVITAFTETVGGSVSVPSSINGYNVTKIDSYAFYACTTISSVTLPNTVKSIGSYAFAYCTTLKGVHIPSSVISIGNKAFFASNNITDVYYSGTESDWKKISIGSSNDSLTNATLHCGGKIHFENSKPGVSYDLSFYDEDFINKATEYNHNLAINSMCFALSTMVHDGCYDLPDKNEQPKAGIKLLRNMGFEAIQPYNYNVRPTTDSIACVVGYKNIGNTTVIAVGIRSAGYENEWSGNANVGVASEKNHEGFNIATKEAIDYINDFILNNKDMFKSTVKFWITGYSRGGATANLVGAAINDGAFKKYFTVEKENNFVYTFEAPCNTTDSNAKSNGYDNIFNLINRLDIVTKVPLQTWNFTRYGRDAYLPTQETYNTNDYNNMLSLMQEKYRDISGGQEYDIDFNFYEFKYYWFKESSTMGMGAFLDNFLEIAGTEIVPNRTVYHNEYEETLERLLPEVFTETEGIDYSEDGFRDFLETRYKISKDCLFGKGTIKTILAAVLMYYFNIPESDAYDAVSITDEIALCAISHPNYTATLIGNFPNKPADSQKTQNYLFYQHESRVNFAWVASLDEATVEAALDVETYRIAKYHCPVDIEVYDSNGTLVGKIVNDIPQEVENGLSTYIDENGAKCFCLPNGEEYTFRVIATDDGQVSCYFEEYNFESNETVISENYYNVDVQKGDILTAIVDELPKGEEKSEVAVYDVTSTEIKPDAVIDVENIEKFTVNVQTDEALESIATGGGEFYCGEFAQLTAYATENEVFVGWYIDGKCVSTDLQYKFMVDKNVAVEAKFEKIEYNIFIQSPSRTTIRCKDSIYLYPIVDGGLPEGTYIYWETSNDNFDVFYFSDDSIMITSQNNGYTDITVYLLNYEDDSVIDSYTIEMYSKAGFFDKIGGFFRSLFGTTKTYYF